jgi:hypothetical protein
VAAAPDAAEIVAGVVSEAPTAAAAVGANGAAMRQVLAALEELGVASKDVQTAQLELAPVHEPYDERTRRAPHIVGYRVSNRARVVVRDVEKLGAVLDRVVEAGANDLGGIAFTVAEPEPLLDQARQRAVADARRKAELYAEAAGVRLGRLLRVEESGQVIPLPMPRYGRMEAAADVPVSPGEVEWTASVGLVYALE